MAPITVAVLGQDSLIILNRLGAEVRLFHIGAKDVCDCVSLALWLRNLAYQVRVARLMKPNYIFTMMDNKNMIVVDYIVRTQ